jgi:hypothetical protein
MYILIIAACIYYNKAKDQSSLQQQFTTLVKFKKEILETFARDD